MKSDSPIPDDVPVRELLRSAWKPTELSPDFNHAVWRRIARVTEVTPAPATTNWIEVVAGWLLRPRIAMAGIMAMLLVGASAGALEGWNRSRQNAQDRYVASVSPLTIPR